MGRPAPKPSNFHAMADAWDQPERFAKELATYYRELRESGHFTRTRKELT